MEKGATHYAHVFYPLTGLTAEKHDSFLEPDRRRLRDRRVRRQDAHPGRARRVELPERRPARHVRGPRLHRLGRHQPGVHPREPERQHALHPDGVRLDDRRGARQEDAAAALAAGDGHPGRAHPEAVRPREPRPRSCRSAGAEQEYFLIDRHFFFARPDLLNAGRTLFGAKPPKGQEFDDHYFGAIPERVLGFMMDAERELFKLGIPAKTRHNEVAPGQFEIAPMFERANVAADHQQLLMIDPQDASPRSTAWSACSTRSRSPASTARASTSTSRSATPPRATCSIPATRPHENAQFLVFCAAVIRAVHKYGGLLRASVASATNDHRLGANEAPPAIISIFLGDQLADVFEQIAKGGATSRRRSKGTLMIGVDTLPDAAERPGRPQPHQPVRLHRQPVRVPRAGLDAVDRRPDGRRSTRSWPSRSTTSPPSSRPPSPTAPTSTPPCRSCSTEIITDHGAVVFNGDGYSDDWQIEAEERGLPNLQHHARRAAAS